MSKRLNKLSFIGRFAIKNIWFEKLKSLALMVLFITIFMIVFLLFSVGGLVRGFYYQNIEDTYKNHDLVISVDENTNARFFSIRNLNHDSIVDTTPLLKINTLMTYESKTYVTILAGDMTSLNKINNYVNVQTLVENEVVITKSLADAYQLKLNDEIYLQLDDNLQFTVKDIVEDDGLLNNRTVFINKDANIANIIEGLGLSGINSDLLKNIFNTVYLEVDNLEIIDELQLIEGYQNLKIEPVYNKDSIEGSINKISLSIWLVFIFVLLAILFILEGLLTNIFKRKTKEIGIINSLGGKSSFYLNMILIETLVYYLIGALLGILLTNFLMHQGLNYLNSNLDFSLSFLVILSGLLVTGLLVLLVIYLNYRMINRTSAVVLSKDNKMVKKTYESLYLIILAILLLTNLFMNSDSILKGTYTLVLIILFGFFLVRGLIKLGTRYKRDSLFSLVSLKNITQNKIILNNLNIVLLSFLAIMLIVISISSNGRYNENRIASIKTDYMIGNISHDTETLVNEVRLIVNVKEATEAYLYQQIQIDDLDVTDDYMVSIETSVIGNYLDLGIDEATLEAFEKTSKPYIILSEKYQYVYGYKSGDIIRLKINNTLDNQLFEILAFHTSNNSMISISNMIELEEYEAVLKNSILVNASANKEVLYQDLINRYQSRLYYIVEMNQSLKEMETLSNQLLDLVRYISYILIACFILTIVNNSVLIFDEMRPTYQKLKVLGMKKKQFIKMLSLEHLYIMVAIITSGLVIILVGIPNFIYIGGLLNVYLPLTYTLSDLLIGTGLFVLFYFLSNLVYVYRLDKMAVLNNINL